MRNFEIGQEISKNLGKLEVNLGKILIKLRNLHHGNIVKQKLKTFYEKIMMKPEKFVRFS